MDRVLRATVSQRKTHREKKTRAETSIAPLHPSRSTTPSTSDLWNVHLFSLSLSLSLSSSRNTRMLAHTHTNRRRGSLALVASPLRQSTRGSPHLQYIPRRPLSPPESPIAAARGGRAETGFSAPPSVEATAASGDRGIEGERGGNARGGGGQRQQRRNNTRDRNRSLEGTPLLSKAESSAAAAAASALAGATETPSAATTTTRAIAAPPRPSSRANLKAGAAEAKAAKHPPSPDDDDGSCPTCLEPFDADNPRMQLACGHAFHLACCLEWEERCVGSLGMSEATCPVCAAPVPEQE